MWLRFICVMTVLDVTVSSEEEGILEPTEPPPQAVPQIANNTTNYDRNSTSQPTVVATMILIIGFLIVMAVTLKKIKSGPKMMRYRIHTRSCYITYGTSGAGHKVKYIQMMNAGSQGGGLPKRITRDNYKMYGCSRFNYNNKIRTTQFLSVSEMWKAKSQLSNNFFVINIIPEEPDEEADCSKPIND